MAQLKEIRYLDNGHISYSPSDVIGRGGFGVVYRGFMDVKNFEDQPVAIKKITLSCYDKNIKSTERMVNLAHENFVKVIKVLTDDEFRYLVMEMCIGTLAQVIDGSFKGPNLSSDISVLRDVINGLYYVHSAKLVHRNIKPENILVSKDARMKLSDLSFADRITYGSCCWMAQEVLEMLVIARAFGADNGKNIKLKVPPSSDIFSAGCVFFVFLTRGVHPFGDECIEQIHNIRKNRPVNIEKLDFNHFARATIDKMIAYCPSDRIKLPDVLKMLETDGTQKRIYSQRKDLFSRNSARSIAENDDALIAMDEEHHLPENNKDNACHEAIEESAVGALADNRSKIGKKYCLKDAVDDLRKLNRKVTNEDHSQRDSNIPSSAPDETLRNLKKSSFPSIEARKVVFHPTLSDLLCCETVDGDVLLLKLSDSSFSHLSCLAKDMENLQLKKTFSISWNVDGTLLAVGYRHGFVAIWESPSYNVIFGEDYSFTDPRIEWNPFCYHRMIIYKLRQKPIVLVDIKLSLNLEITLSAGIMAIAWIFINKFVVAYSDGSMYIHLISEDCGEYSVTTFKKLDNLTNNVVKCLKWSQGHKRLASGSCDGFIKFWSIEKNKPICTYRTGNGVRCQTLEWLRKETTKTQGQTTKATQHQLLPVLACGLSNGSIVILNPMKSCVGVRKILLGHSGDVDRLLFSPNREFLMSLAKKFEETKVSTYKKELCIWSTKAWTLHFSTYCENAVVDWNASSKALAVACATIEAVRKNPPTMKLDIFNVV